MTVRELIEELNAMIENDEISENAKVKNAEDDDIFSIINPNKKEVVIYF